MRPSATCQPPRHGGDSRRRLHSVISVVAVLAAVLVTSAARSSSPARHQDSAAATVTFSGVVQDAISQASIAGARVNIANSSASSDSAGHYTLTVAAGKSFQATASAAGYLSVSLTIAAGGALLSGNVTWDFKGPYGLKSLGNLTAVISGMVKDGLTGKAVANASVATPGKQVVTDTTGHYSLTIPGAPRVQLQTAALGYQLRPPLTLSMPGNGLIQGPISFDFSGGSGLQSAFADSTGDVLNKFDQELTAAAKSLPFAGSSRQAMENTYAVTYPNGDAGLQPISVDRGKYHGILPLAKGAGIYQLEINAANGFAIFNLPVFYGVKYTPPPMRAAYSPEDATLTSNALEVKALQTLNALRAKYGRPPFIMLQALESGARAHSIDIVTHNYYDVHPHQGSNGSSPEDRIKLAKVPYTQIGEDVASDMAIRGAIDGLMLSPGHRANILLNGFNRVGIGVARQPSGLLVMTVDFVRTP